MSLKSFLKPNKEKVTWWIVLFVAWLLSWFFLYPYKEIPRQYSLWDEIIQGFLLLLIIFPVPYFFSCIITNARQMLKTKMQYKNRLRRVLLCAVLYIIVICVICLFNIMGFWLESIGKSLGEPIIPGRQTPISSPQTMSPQDLARLSCHADDDCIVNTIYSDCCWTCGSEAINKVTAEKEEKERQIRCVVKEKMCPSPECMWWPGRELIPLCRDNLCILETDYIIKQAVISRNIEKCKEEKHIVDENRCYHTMAILLQDSGVCKKIDDSSDTWAKKDCYGDLAILSKDTSLCEPAGGGTCWIQMAVYHKQPELVRHIADWLDYETTKASVEKVIGWFEECDERTPEKRNECYLIDIEKAWAPYYTLEIMCDKVDSPEACYKKYIQNYPTF